MKVYIEIEVPDDFAARPSKQSIVEREIRAARWVSHTAVPAQATGQLNNQRARFEAWADANGLDRQPLGIADRRQQCWSAWQSALDPKVR
jgi:hypothetical protein